MDLIINVMSSLCYAGCFWPNYAIWSVPIDNCNSFSITPTTLHRASSRTPSHTQSVPPLLLLFSTTPLQPARSTPAAPFNTLHIPLGSANATCTIPAYAGTAILTSGFPLSTASMIFFASSLGLTKGPKKLESSGGGTCEKRGVCNCPGVARIMEIGELLGVGRKESSARREVCMAIRAALEAA